MITEFDAEDELYDVYFTEQDKCFKCLISDYCPLIKSIQWNVVSLNNDKPFKFCSFYVTLED